MDYLWNFIGGLRNVSKARTPWSPPSLQSMAIESSSQAQNPLMIQFFTWDSKGDGKASWWQHLEQELPRLRDLGVTHVWVPPPNKAMSKTGRGYDAYDLWDLGEFHQKGTKSTRWGSKAELLSVCSSAKNFGIEIIIDAVLGHKLGGDLKETFNAVPVDERNRLRKTGPLQEIESWTRFEFPGRKQEYSPMEWNHEHFTGVDNNTRRKGKQIYYIPAPHRSCWSKFVDKELGNYDYLLGCDIDHTHPEVRADMLQWGSWVVATTGAGGFRLDAIKHMDRRFVVEFLLHVKQTLHKETLFAVSEYWSGDIEKVEEYVRLLQGQTSFFDVPLHYRLHEASKIGANPDLRYIFSRTLVQRRPWDAVTFVDNHDTQIGQSLESWVYAGFKLQAYALILLRSLGFPCVFYGDLYPNEECYDPRLAKTLDLLIRARKLYAYGSTVDFFAYRNCIGWIRTGDDKHDGCAVVVRTNFEFDVSKRPYRFSHGRQEYGNEVRMRMPIKSGSSLIYKDYLNSSGEVQLDAEGWASFPCPKGGVSIWIPKSE